MARDTVEIRVLTSAEATRSALETLVSGSDSIQIAAAFVRQSGVDELRLLHRPIRELHVLAGTDFGLTEIGALESLHAPPTRECRLYYTRQDVEDGVFHPKLYLGSSGRNIMAVLGSSNLTGPALTRNIELNVQLTTTADDDLREDLAGFFRRLWHAPGVLPLTAEVINTYRADQAARERLWRQLRHSPEFRHAQSLVQRTLLSHLAARAEHKWLLVTSEDNYFRCLGRQRWGDENYARISRIRPGDLLIFYIKGAQKLGAIAIAKTPVYRSSEATWADREYPYRFDFDVFANPGAPLDFRPFVPQLTFLKRKDDKWGTALQTSSLELPDRDAALLIDAITTAQAAPDLRLAIAEPLQPYGAKPDSPT